MGVPVFVSSRGMMTNQPIALPDKVTTDLERSEVLAPERNEGEEGNHQPVAVTDGVILADRGARCWFALVHQLLPKVEQLEAGNDGPGWSRCGRRP